VVIWFLNGYLIIRAGSFEAVSRNSGNSGCEICTLHTNPTPSVAMLGSRANSTAVIETESTRALKSSANRGTPILILMANESKNERNQKLCEVQIVQTSSIDLS
jgi:hypothetical protein